MLTHRFPFPPNRGDRIRSYHLLRELTTKFAVTLGSFADEPVTDSQLQHIEQLCDEVLIVRPSRIARLVGAAKSIVHRKSITEGMFASSSFAKEVTRRQLSQPYDAVLVFCSSMFPYIEKSEFENTHVVVDLVDVDSRKWEQLGRDATFPKNSVFLREAKRLRIVEQRIANRANAVTLVSNEEANLFRGVVRVPGRTKIAGISNGVDTYFFQPSVANCECNGVPLRLVFTGVMNYAPNVQGMEWFCRKVLPALQGKIDLQTTIVGRSPNARVRSLGQLEGVKVTGEVPDVRPYLNAADIAISPLSLARGIQNKVLEAMAMQRAVVCTSQSAEGISGHNQIHFVIADTVDQWCDALVDLSKNREKREQLALAARELVVQSYSWSAQTKPMLDLLAPSGQCPAPRSPTNPPQFPSPRIFNPHQANV